MARVLFHRQQELKGSKANRSSIPVKYKYDIFNALPRRKRVQPADMVDTQFPSGPRNEIKPKNRMVVCRLLIWLKGIFFFFLGKVVSSILKPNSVTNEARTLRKNLEKMGPVAIKVGQQLSIRADLLPFEYCEELSRMLDRMNPFPVDYAIEAIERTTGKPLTDTFEVFDPVPIGSASLACVYQAKLHTGELVAVKVKRPRIASKMAADIKALSWIIKFAEHFGVIRSGVASDLIPELSNMLGEESDFVLEARYTEIFRGLAEKNPYVSAPKVYDEISGEDVIVSEFISGVFLIEILSALEQNDVETIAKLTGRGFDVEKLSKNMMRIFHWEIFEIYFFHADPHPANIIVRPDNTLVMIDFGSCGSISKMHKNKLLQFNQQVVEQDFHGLAQTTISMMEPLPPMEISGYYRELVSIYRNVFTALKSKNAKWYEKCTGGVWMKIITISRNYNIPVQPDLLRIFRTSFMYDSIIYRLNPHLDPAKEFLGWYRKYNRRNRKKLLKGLRDRICGPLDQDYTSSLELMETYQQCLRSIRNYVETPKYSFRVGVKKAAFGFSTAVKGAMGCLNFFILCLLARHFYYIFTNPSILTEKGYFTNSFAEVVTHPLFLSAILVYLYITMTKIIRKIDEIDT